MPSGRRAGRTPRATATATTATAATAMITLAAIAIAVVAIGLRAPASAAPAADPLRARPEISAPFWASRCPAGKARRARYIEPYLSEEQRRQPGGIGGQNGALISGRALTPLQQQRYVMGTMFDIVAYHGTRADAAQAIERAMQEIVRLDRVLSHFKEDSDLSRLNREGRHGFVTVDPSLFEVIESSLSFSRMSAGRFDVTIAPLLRTWKDAYAHGQAPAEGAIAEAKRCVGYEKIETARPNRVRFKSDCLAIDLGGIGKGYAVDRALAVLKAAGIRHALINAGGSSIASLGTPPGRNGWPVRLNGRVQGRDVLLLRDTSMSTSQQHVVPLMASAGTFGEILDPRTGIPPSSPTAVTVVMENGTAADALSTALVLLPIDAAPKLLEQFPDASALWITVSGELRASYGEARLHLTDSY